MNNLAEPMLASMDWEKLLPVAFFVLYGIAQLIGSLKKGKKQPDEQPEVDVAERARQVREEIRRKIAERRQALEGQGGDQSSRPRQYDPTQPDGQPLFRPAPKPQPAPAPVTRHQEPLRRLQPQPRLRPAQPAQPAWSGSGSRMSSLEKRLEEQRAILEKSQRQQREARERARQMEREAGISQRMAGEVGTAEIGSTIYKESDNVHKTRIRQKILADLSNPDGLKRAVLYREILGPPLGLR